MEPVKEVIWPAVIAMAALGVITLWLKQIMTARSSATPGLAVIGVREYWLTYWPATIFALTSTVGGIALLDYLDMLSGKLGPIAAFGVGYVGNSIADLIGGRVQAMINAAPALSPDHVSRKTKEEIKGAVVGAVETAVAEVNKKEE